jgi:hypothetical protein
MFKIDAYTAATSSRRVSGDNTPPPANAKDKQPHGRGKEEGGD